MITSKAGGHLPPFGLTCPELRGSLDGMRYPAFAEQKYDGEFGFLLRPDGGCLWMINKYNKARRDFPALDAIEAQLDSKGVSSVMLLGELYYGQGTQGSLYELLSHKEDDRLNIALFDIAFLDGEDLRKFPLLERRETLMRLFDTDDTKLFLIPPVVVTDKEEVREFFERCTQIGKFEGIVVKPLDSPLILGPCPWAKVKYKDQSDYVVYSIDPVKERIEIEASVVSAVSGNPMRVVVGVKVSNKDKAVLKVGDMVTIEHQGVLKSGSLRHPVFIGKAERSEDDAGSEQSI